MDFSKYLIKQYPSLANFARLDFFLKNLVSDQHIELPQQVFERIQKSIDKIYEFGHSPSAIEKLTSTSTEHEQKILQANAPQKSILSAFDYHYDKDTDQLSLIEINTNASAYLVADAIYKFKNLTGHSDATNKLYASFQNDAALAGLKSGWDALVIDEDLEQQKMFFEFLMYQDFLNSRGHKTQICEFKKVSQEDTGKFIYNRFTDFLLERPESQILLNHFLKSTSLLSPSPKEYLLMAAKDRLEDFANNNVSEVLIPSKAFSEFADMDELWTERKKYYFKPRRMFGGKAVFRGESISRKRFNELDINEYIAQESRPPGTIGEWKFDLRVYTYGTEIQLIIARTFQGQLLNFSSEGGGLATVSFL